MPELELIVGIVKNLRIRKSSENLLFTEGDKNLADAGPIGSVLLEQFAASSVLASASSGADVDMDFFECTVNEMVVIGRFHKVEFIEGENVEFVVLHTPGGAEVQAARSYSRRMIWMLPYRSRGFLAQKKSSRKNVFLLAVVAAAAMWVCDYFILKTYLDSSMFYRILILVEVFALVWIVAFFVSRRFLPLSKEATLVFEAFGYAHPDMVDLPKIHTQARKKLQSELKKYPGSVQPWSFRF